MADATFTSFHEEIIKETREEMNTLKKLVADIHAVVTNGLKDNVKQLREDVAETKVRVAKISDPAERKKSCPIVRARGERRKSWDWILTVFVAISSILLNFGTFYVLIKTGVL